MVRDRLQELLQKGKISEDDTFSSDTVVPTHGVGPPVVTQEGNDVVIEMGWIDSDIGRFLKQVESLREKMCQTENDIEKIKHVQGKLLDSPSRSEEKEEELDQLMGSVKADCKELMARIKDLEQSNLSTDNEPTDSSEATLARIQSVQYRALLRTYKELLEYYQKVQLDYQEKCKTRVKTLLVIRNGGGDEGQFDNDIEQFLESGSFGNVSVFTDGYQEKTEEAKEDLALADARLDHLLKLENALRELHDLFIEMARLVELQGEQLDNIEKNVLEARDVVEGARGQLANAQKLQKSARKKKIIIIIVLIILAVILGLVIYFSIPKTG